MSWRNFIMKPVTIKSIRECDEIILWFGHGEYVDLANALKAEVNGGRGAGDLGPDMQQTVGATYMFDSEGLLERSGLNVPLNVDEYMQDDDEYSDVYDLEEGGQTEAMAAAAKTKTEEDILAAAGGTIFCAGQKSNSRGAESDSSGVKSGSSGAGGEADRVWGQPWSLIRR